MANHLIYINDSTGELDWIAPYIKQLSMVGDDAYVILALPRMSGRKKMDIFESYFLNSQVVRLSTNLCDNLILKVEFFLERVVAKLIKNPEKRILLNGAISVSLSYFASLKLPNLDYLYLDYNLKEKAIFRKIKRTNRNAKIIIYPHSTAIMTNTRKTPKPKVATVDCDLFLESTEFNSRFYDYQEKIRVVGSPTLDIFRALPLRTLPKKTVLFLTRRNVSEFAMDEAETLKKFKILINFCKKHDYAIHIKHHPRDTELYKWRELYVNANVEEIEYDITGLNNNYAAVFATYTSAVVLFAAKGIPTFDFTGYAGNTEKLSYHYIDENQTITHELIELGITNHLVLEECINFEVFSQHKLNAIGENQKRSVDAVFRFNSIINIQDAVSKL